MLAHADFTSFIAYPKLLVTATILKALTRPANMACWFLADHTASLHSMVRIVAFAFLGWCRTC